MEKVSRVVVLKNFFSTPEKPVANTEFMQFWKACSAAERQEFAEAAAKQLGVELEPAAA